MIYTNFMSQGIFSTLQPRVTSWLQQAGINKVIVGHQPAGDCVAIMPGGSGSGSEARSFAVSADTCYSTFVQYETGVVSSLFTPSGVKAAAAAATGGETGEGATASAGGEWKSVTPILREKGLLHTLPADAKPTASDKADTRAPLCVAEPCVSFDTEPRLFTSSTTSAGDAASSVFASSVASEAVAEGKIVLKGVLASGHVHGVTLPEVKEDAIVGLEVSFLLDARRLCIVVGVVVAVC